MISDKKCLLKCYNISFVDQIIPCISFLNLFLSKIFLKFHFTIMQDSLSIFEAKFTKYHFKRQLYNCYKTNSFPILHHFLSLKKTPIFLRNFITWKKSSYCFSTLQYVLSQYKNIYLISFFNLFPLKCSSISLRNNILLNSFSFFLLKSVQIILKD